MQALVGAGGMGALARHGGRDMLAPPVPVLGAELISNGSMESGDPPTGWIYNANVTMSRVADERTGGSGSYALRMTNSAMTYGNTLRNLSIPIGSWIAVNAWARQVTADVYMYLYPVQFLTLQQAGTSWTNFFGTGRALANVESIRFQNLTNVSGAYSHLDDVSVKLLNLSSSISAQTYGTPDCDLSSACTRIAYTQVGLIGRLDDPKNPANFLICYETGMGRVKIDKCLSGVYSNIIDGAVTYVAGQKPRLLCSGNNVSAYYNGVQVGTTQVVADAAIVNNKYHGLFNTHASNVLADYRNAAV